MTNKCLPILFGLSIISQASAQLAIPEITEFAWQNDSNQALSQAGLQDVEDELPQIKSPVLGEKELIEAKTWALTSDEEKRYLQLMQGRSGLYYQDLHMSPVDILGLNSQTDSEREHFAELAAKQEAQKVAKNIAWNNAFHVAYNKLFKDVPVVGNFDPSPYSPYAHTPLQLKTGESLYLFVRQDDAIKTILMTLLEAIKSQPKSQLHFLFVGMNDEDIQLWASRQQLPHSLVSRGQITLNQGDQQYRALTVSKKETPLLLLSAKGNSTVVDMGRF